MKCLCLVRLSSLLVFRFSRARMESTSLSLSISSKILKKFSMEDSKPVGNLMSTRLKLTKDDDSKEVNQTLYRLMIRKL